MRSLCLRTEALRHRRKACRRRARLASESWSRAIYRRRNRI